MVNPINQFDYVMAKGEGNKGASYKYQWKPDWRMPPGLNKGKLALQLAFCLGLAAVPVWGLPYLRGPKDETAQAHADMYMVAKKKNRDDRLKWLNSDDMPYK
uniref:Uncharacterized protein n=1 Tax=Chlamydomonas leiostraca TaxID=1034604 RepID=A0A7S0WXQ1_9CHLO|mmetsp:Transcript_32736/g.83043  ORF Transcript_32736/g.83043 Transcript_32736/m.83043 type:complete len:102 (+) Transcript_32736:62-367(+)|eukprot:CAMPEP_0202863700 /NCGR_PEP_ID=MMETSP1391-20130828/4231_1 /ASSEMBLY_ACC=CAM_ASM_000867 /TAXON_ID=1034604 /ORGANISM="Chlamydomonas leiostraca, Strain SAG 11-49" /LENGTH=101 /DNA_ID=CAMNT_0049543359 /DNA_START=58 /DNA_END=363 /DNA_ORIENTATION=-